MEKNSSRIDDFSAVTKKQLGERSGYRCCFMGCGISTLGPGDESENSIARTGMACHISAASAGASSRRYVSSMSSSERRSYSNGIWTCYSHGKLIDTDEKRFSIDTLKAWKRIGEEVARIMREQGFDYKTALKIAHSGGLNTESLSITELGGTENNLIGRAMEDSGLFLLWGKPLSAGARGFFIEHTRNAFQHGGATNVKFEIFPNKIVLTDNGKKFNPKELVNLQLNSGGTVSAKGLLEKFEKELIFVSEYRDGMNITTLARIERVSDLPKITSCFVEMTQLDFLHGKVNIKIDETCKEVFILLPEFVVASDFRSMLINFPSLKMETRPITFVGGYLNEWDKKMLIEQYPTCKIVELEDRNS